MNSAGAAAAAAAASSPANQAVKQEPAAAVATTQQQAAAAAANQKQNPNWWSAQEDKIFEKILSDKFGARLQDILEEVSKQVGTKDVEAVRRRYEQLEEDIKNIEAGRVPLPNYADSGSTATANSRKGSKSSSGKKEQGHSERKKGIPWTEEEHRLFLLGLEKFGKGDWRSISRNFVVSRTPTQVASHAQKYFIRLSSMNKRDKRRASIHDITSVDQADVQNMAAARAQAAAQQGMSAAQAQQGGKGGNGSNGGPGGMFGGGMVSMPPPKSYVSNMSMPPQSGQQYV